MGRRAAALIAAVLGIALLAGCGEDGEDTGERRSRLVEAPQPEAVPSPEAGQGDLFLEDLRRIAPLLEMDDTEAIKNARYVCLDIRSEEPEETVRGGTITRFAVDGAQADAIIYSIRSTFC
ncbi:hypothetical protein AB0O07_05625 [Streptomyces sp. NPDC093085]|uniref:hypothetical protein n=1 Tax=Streptomyces sp. NPDC093085 TaxID=3155068 RepID=UPI003432C57C